MYLLEWVTNLQATTPKFHFRSEMTEYGCNATFLVPPEIEVERPWVHAAPGVTAELACNVLADPHAKVSVITVN